MYYFAEFAEPKFAEFAWKLNSLQFSNKSILESAQQIKKIDLDHYIINHQWFKLAYTILCNLENTNSQILPTLPGNWSLTKKGKKFREKETFKDSKHFCKHLLGILGGLP